MSPTIMQSPLQPSLLFGEEERIGVTRSERKVIAELPLAPQPKDDSFYWSASRIRKLLLCPRQFRYAYLDRLKTVPSAAMVLGRILHEIICSAHAVQMETGSLPPADELLSRFDKVWPEVVDNIELRYPKAGPEKDDYHGWGREMLRVFRNVASLSEPPLAVELAFEFEVPIRVAGEPRTVRLRGVIDRLDEVTLENGEPGVIIVDYKSSRKRIKKAEIEEDTQLFVYALAVRELLDLPVVQVEILSLRDGETIPIQRIGRQLDRLVKDALPIAQGTLESGRYVPVPGYWCRWCDFQERCEAEGTFICNSNGNGGDREHAAS